MESLDEQLKSSFSLFWRLHGSLENEKSLDEFVEKMESLNNSIRHLNSLVLPLYSLEENIGNSVEYEDNPTNLMGWLDTLEIVAKSVDLKSLVIDDVSLENHGVTLEISSINLLSKEFGDDLVNVLGFLENCVINMEKENVERKDQQRMMKSKLSVKVVQ